VVELAHIVSRGGPSAREKVAHVSGMGMACTWRLPVGVARTRTPLTGCWRPPFEKTGQTGAGPSDTGTAEPPASGDGTKGLISLDHLNTGEPVIGHNFMAEPKPGCRPVLGHLVTNPVA
jgi:hypothetical protein